MQRRLAQAAQQEPDLTCKEIVADFPVVGVRANAAHQPGAFHLGERRFNFPALESSQGDNISEAPWLLGPFRRDHACENARCQIPRIAVSQAVPKIELDQTGWFLDLTAGHSLHHQPDHVEGDRPVETASLLDALQTLKQGIEPGFRHGKATAQQKALRFAAVEGHQFESILPRKETRKIQLEQQIPVVGPEDE